MQLGVKAKNFAQISQHDKFILYYEIGSIAVHIVLFVQQHLENRKNTVYIFTYNSSG